MIVQSPLIQILRGGIDYTTRWGVVSYWKLDEASDTRSDTVGSNHLADNNTVTQAAGKVGAASAQFTAAQSEYLSIVNNAFLSTGDVDYWLAAWVWLDGDAGVARVVMGKGSLLAFEYLFYTTAARTGRLDVYSPNASLLGTASTAAMAAGAWHLLVAYHDATNNEVGISLDGASFVTSATTGAPTAGNEGVFVGQNGGGGAYMDGRIDALAFGKSPPGGVAGVIAEIRDRLYNSGNGREYPWN